MIGVLTTSYPREEGDPAGAFVHGFARWLAGACAVEVIAAGPGASRVDGIPVTRVDGRGLFYRGGAPDALTSPAAWARAARFQLDLAAAARGRRWDAVVSHWVVPSGMAAALAHPRVPHLAIAHSSDVVLLRRSMAGRAALRWLARRADLVYSARHLVVEGAPGRVVPMGIDDPASGDRAAARGRLMLQRTTALFLGRLVPVKGLDLLLDALPDGLDLLVAGDGPMREPWRRRAGRSPQVRFLGEVRGALRRDLFAAADLLVVPSLRLPDGREEGTPTVALEALAAGLPVVATRTGGLPDVIVDGETGLLVAPEVPALRAALARVAADPPLRARLSERARLAGRRHLWEEVGPALGGNMLHTCHRIAYRSVPT